MMNKHLLNFIRMTVLLATKAKRNAFIKSLSNIEQTQSQTLSRIIAQYKKTKLGQQSNLLASDDYQRFSQKIGFQTYEKLKPYIEEQMESNDSVLSYGSVRCYEKTSGSSGKSKYIPYNTAMFDSFSDYFLIWLNDLLQNETTLTSGKTFLSLSPVFNEKSDLEKDIDIGLSSDSEYANFFGQKLIDLFIVTPKNIKSVKDPFAYRFILALSILSSPDLEIISIWNPTYLDSLLDFISEHRHLLNSAFEKGFYQYGSLRWNFKTTEIIRMQLNKPINQPLDYKVIWPDIKILSCWVDGTAKQFSSRLVSRLQVKLCQAKGLLATEAPMTIPFVSANGAVPFLNHIFFEFVSQSGGIKLLHQLNIDEVYELVITAPNGFLRYKIDDKVKVTGFYKEAPILEFVGRSDRISDIVGEKLSTDYVDLCFIESPTTLDDCFIIPDLTSQPACYRLVIADEQNEAAAEYLEEKLMQTTHYRLARLLGQLGPLKTLKVRNSLNTYYQTLENLGMKWGDIKFQRLINRTDFIGLLK